MTISITIIMMGVIIIAIILLMIFAISILKKNKEVGYEVFEFNDNGEVVVLTGIPVSYKREDIQKVEFSLQSTKGGFCGRFRIIQNNGRKSKKYLYDASVYTKKLSLRSASLEDIKKATEYLRQQLRAKGILCEFLTK